MQLITWSFRILFVRFVFNLLHLIHQLNYLYYILFSSNLLLLCSKEHDIDDGLTELRSGSSPDEGIGTELDSPKGMIIYTKHHVVITWTDFIAYRQSFNSLISISSSLPSLWDFLKKYEELHNCCYHYD
jgi:hypothetical protein